MEKFYKVSPDSPVYDEYFEHKEFAAAMCIVYTMFAKEHGIETTRFIPDADRLVIDPTAADKKKFKDQIRQQPPGQFKKKSETGKAWVALCKKKGLVTKRQPFMPFVFNVFGRSYHRLFDLDGTLYCTFESQSRFDNPPHFNEIKASEFYKIMEDAGVELD